MLLIIFVCSFCFTAFADCTLKIVGVSSLSGNQADDIVAVAKANLDKTGSQLGATEHWCTDFIYNCARKAGIGEDVIPTTGRVSTLKEKLLALGATEVTTPKAGDIVFYGPSHAALMADSVYAYQGNFNGKGSGSAFWTSSRVVYCKYTSASNYTQYGATFVRPKYKTAPANTLTVKYKAGGASISSQTYKLISDSVCSISNNSAVKDTWTYNKPKKTGLYNAGTFGLYKTGWHFCGWQSPSGNLLGQDDAALLPSQIEPEIKNKSCSVILTALWEPNVLSVRYNANGGNVDSSAKYILDPATGDIRKKSTNLTVSVDWVYNEPKSSGLYNASTFSLKRSGYKFIGWSNQSEGGEVIHQDDATIRPSDLCPAIESGTTSVTMYACWEYNHAHTIITDEAVEPSCTENGKTEGSHCEECGFVITKQQDIPALGHDFSVDITTDKEPTCTENGVTSRHCIRCEEVTDVGEIAAAGHIYEEKVNKRQNMNKPRVFRSRIESP